MSEPFVRPDVRALLDMIAAAPPAPKMSEAGPVAARATMNQMGQMFDLPADDLVVRRDLATPGGIGLRLYDAQGTRGASPVLVFFHGGGFVIGSLDDYDSACSEMARVLGLPVVSVDYRLAPEHPWPAAPDDCEAAARWIAESATELGFPVTGLILAGDSAGGGLTIVTAMALRDAPVTVPVLAQMPLYPVTDLATEHPSYQAFGDGFLLERGELRWFWDCYTTDRTNPRVSPLHGDLAGLPPTLLVTCSLDPLRDEGRAFAAAAIGAGVPTHYREARGMIHGFLSFRQALPSARTDLAETLAALQALLATEPSQGQPA